VTRATQAAGRVRESAATHSEFTKQEQEETMTYSITLTAAELNLIGAALHRLPPEQIALIDSLRRQAEAQEEQARAIGEGEAAAAEFAAAAARPDGKEAPR
jgi:hypothetical protein